MVTRSRNSYVFPPGAALIPASPIRVVGRPRRPIWPSRLHPLIAKKTRPGGGGVAAQPCHPLGRWRMRNTGRPTGHGSRFDRGRARCVKRPLDGMGAGRSKRQRPWQRRPPRPRAKTFRRTETSHRSPATAGQPARPGYEASLRRLALIIAGVTATTPAGPPGDLLWPLGEPDERVGHAGGRHSFSQLAAELSVLL